MNATAIAIEPTQATIASMSTLFRLSVPDYHDMIASGILTPEDRVELLDGILVKKMSQNAPHHSTIQRLTLDFVRLTPPGWQPRFQLPITLELSEPEPDCSLVRGDRRTYDARAPGPADFGIVIEVADTSLRLDREVKARLYAEAGIPEFWLINLVDSCIEVYTQPTGAAYLTQTVYTAGQAVPLILDGQTIGRILVADVLP